MNSNCYLLIWEMILCKFIVCFDFYNNMNLPSFCLYRATIYEHTITSFLLMDLSCAVLVLGPSLISVGSNPNAGAYRQVRFQGTSAISSSSAASSPAAKPQNFMQAQRLTPKQFGNRAMVTQS